MALAYAFSEERHTANRPAMARATDMHLGEPGPLAGMDGAAEIGTAREFLERGLEPLHLAVLYARYGQRTTECKHCGSHGVHLVWTAALRMISENLSAVLLMPSVDSKLRDVLVWRYFGGGDGNTLEALAKQHNCSLATSRRASSKITDWIKGSRKRRGEDPVYGIEQAAHAAAETLLRGGGFIP